MGSRVCKSLLGDRHARGERAHRASTERRTTVCCRLRRVAHRAASRLTERELFGNPWYFDSDPGTSKQLAESFPTVPHSPSNSEGKPVYSFLASASPPLTVERAYSLLDSAGIGLRPCTMVFNVRCLSIGLSLASAVASSRRLVVVYCTNRAD